MFISLLPTKQLDNKIAAPKDVLPIEYKKEPEEEQEKKQVEERPLSPPPEPVKVEPPVVQPPDLLVVTESLFASSCISFLLIYVAYL